MGKNMSGYPDPQNPRHVRALIHNTYSRYVNGQDVFPGIEMNATPEQLPRRTQEIAGKLAAAWEAIDTDESFFYHTVQTITSELGRSDTDNPTGLVVTRIGRNAINIADINLDRDPPLSVVTLPLRGFLDAFQGHVFAETPSGSVVLEGNEMVGPIQDPLIVRGSNVSALFGTTPDETSRIVTALAG